MQGPSRRGHGRAASGHERRAAMVRRSTKGPLDADDALVDDPLAASTGTPPNPSRAPPPNPTAAAAAAAAPNPTPAASLPSRLRSPAHADSSPHPPHNALPARPSGIDDMPSKDFSFMQDPQAYHVLPVTNVPPPFLNAPHAPPVSSPIDSLLYSGHYRLAATAAARNLVSAAPGDHDTLFHLVHVRLACLCLLQEHALAAQESKVLGDLGSAFYRHPLTNAHLVPWELRLLVVRLAALGYGEWRKGIMGYYELARECRENIIRGPAADKQLWASRLRDCGVRVANVLVEMGDLEGAARHLTTLAGDSNQTREIAIMETLVWLRMGHVQAARRCLARAEEASPDELIDGTLNALIQLANSDYQAAVTSLQALHEQFPEDAMVAQNLAVCLLYTGHISDAKNILSDLVDTSPPFHSLILNLSTVFELCTERNREKKLALAEKLASRKEGAGGVGWELTNAEFKL